MVMMGCVIGAAVVAMVNAIVSVAAWGVAGHVEGLICYANGLSMAMEGAGPRSIKNICKHALFTGVELWIGCVRGEGGAQVCLEPLFLMASGRESLARGSGADDFLV